MKPDKISPVPKRPNGTGSIFLRHKTWWVKYYRFGKPYWESSHSHDRSDAQKLLNKRLGEISTGKFVGLAPEKVTIADLIDLVVADLEFRQLRSRHIVGWQSKAPRELLGAIMAARFSTADFQRYVVARRAAGAADASINRELSIVRRGFSLALAADPPLVQRAPKIPQLAENNVRQGFLEPEQYEKLLAELPLRLKALFVCAYHVGARKGELRKIRWEQVDFEAGVIRLRLGETKSGKPRTMPIYAGDMERWLRRQRLEQPEGCPWVFNHRGRPVGAHLDGWNEACERAGVPGLLFHDLRRTAVRNMKRAGVQDKIAMEISGHLTREVFDRYNIVDEGDLTDAAKRVGAYFAARKKERAAKLRRVK